MGKQVIFRRRRRLVGLVRRPVHLGLDLRSNVVEFLLPEHFVAQQVLLGLVNRVLASEIRQFLFASILALVIRGRVRIHPNDPAFHQSRPASFPHPPDHRR